MFRPIVFIGLISYSLYLWHYPLLVFAEYASPNDASWELRVVMLLLGFLLAGLSLRYIETPIRQRSVFPRSGQVFALAGCSMLGLLLLGGGAFLRNSAPSWVPAQAKEYAAARTNSAFLINTTLEQAATGQFAEIGSSATNQPVVMLIWGDSHAMALTPALDDLCRQYSVRGMQATHSLTPPLLGYSDRNYGMKGASVDFYTSVLRFISQKRIKAVILAADWLRYGPPDSLRTDLAGTVRDILAAGARVYIVKDVAKPGFDVPHRAVLRVVYGGDPAKLTIPAEQYHAANDPIEFIFDDLSRMGATVLDAPRYYLNTNGSYDVVRDGKALYWDSSHLSVEGSRVLKPMFEPIFRGDLGLDGKDALPSREAKKSGK